MSHKFDNVVGKVQLLDREGSTLLYSNRFHCCGVARTLSSTPLYCMVTAAGWRSDQVMRAERLPTSVISTPDGGVGGSVEEWDHEPR